MSLADEILAISDLKAYWKLDDGSGTNVNDYGSGGHDGTAGADVKRTAAGLGNEPGKASQFGYGSACTVSVPHHADFDISAAFSEVRCARRKRGRGMIGLVLIVKNEEKMIEACLESAKPLISSWTIVDTGSIDDTKKIIRRVMKGIPGKLYERKFVDFGHNRTEALALAQGSAQWLLELDADMTVEAHEGLLDWLRPDPDPDVGAWMVQLCEGRMTWRLPRLIRGNLKWRYIGPVHEYLHPEGRKRRSLLGLTLYHHGSSRHPIQKFDHYLTLLKPGLEAGDPRAVFYSAECLRFLGCIPQAIDLYRRREEMNGFAEEAWYAGYMAAKLSKSAPELIKAWEKRPWRAEPLYAAADLVQQTKHDDLLFLEHR